MTSDRIATIPPGRCVAVLALPGALGWWLAGRVNAAAAAAGLKPEVRTVGQFDVEFGPPPGEGGFVIYLAHAPSRAFVGELAAGGMPAVIALSDPIGIIGELSSTWAGDPLQPLRDLSASAAILNRVIDLPGARIGVVDDEADAVKLIAMAAACFDLPVASFGAGMPEGRSDGEPVDQAIMRDGGPDRAALRVLGQPDETMREAIDNAVGTMVTRLRGASGFGQIAWRHALFLSGDEIGSPARMIVDLTGPARVLYYGPYLHLPDGAWTMSAILGFSEDTDDMVFKLELQRAHHVIASGWVKPERKGLFRVEMAVDLDDAEHALEVRLHSHSGAIGGHAGLALVTFTPRTAGVANPTA
jgi:hypothetical protein